MAFSIEERFLVKVVFVREWFSGKRRFFSEAEFFCTKIQDKKDF